MKVAALTEILDSLDEDSQVLATTPHGSYTFVVTGVVVDTDSNVVLRLKQRA